MSRSVQALATPQTRTGVRAAVATIAMIAAIAAAPALATQQRSFVASTGSDVAACTLAAPCRSFAAAIAHTNADGEVIVLDSAGYGPVTIAKSISLIAPTGVYAGITVATGDGVTIDAPGATVVLRGLAINGLGGTHGVRVHDAQRVRIESCTISNMDQDGIHHEAAGAEVIVLDTIVRDNGNFGINLIADASIVLDHVRSEHNDASAMHIGGGGSLVSVSASASDSVLVHNAGHGIVVSGGNGQTIRLHVNRSTIAYNGGSGVLVQADPTSAINVALAGNSVTANGDIGVTLTGAGGGGFVEATLSGNSVTFNGSGGVHVHGIAIAYASGNSMATNGASDLLCDTGSLIDTVGNNLALITTYTPDTCHLVFPGQ